jgi:hypothetical protein
MSPFVTGGNRGLRPAIEVDGVAPSTAVVELPPRALGAARATAQLPRAEARSRSPSGESTRPQ